MMTSLIRPTIVSQPSASTVARSPVRNQPRVDRGARLRRVDVADEQLGAAEPELAGLAGRHARPGGGVADPQPSRAGAAPVGLAARSTGSSGVLVVIVGASVEP